MSENLTMTVRVKVTGLRFAVLRLRCVAAIVWLAAKVGGTGFEVDMVGFQD